MITEDMRYEGKAYETEEEEEEEDERKRERKLRTTSGFVTLSDKCPLLLLGSRNLL